MPTLVTLSNPEGEDAAQFSNQLDDALPLGPESAVELVSLAVIQDQVTDIIENENDTVSFRIGKTAGALQTATVRPGTYTVSELARELEYQLNAQIPANREGACWIVAPIFDGSGFVTGWNIRIETSFVLSPVDFDDLGTDIVSTPGVPVENGTDLQRNNGGGDWGPQAFASTFEALTRGRGYFECALVDAGGDLPDVAIGLADEGIDAATDPVDFLKIGVRIASGTSGGTARAHLLFDGVETPVLAATWTPTTGDLVRVSREDGNLVVEFDRGLVTTVLATESYEDLEDLDVQFPTVQINTANGELHHCLSFADGDTVTDGLGTRNAYSRHQAIVNKLPRQNRPVACWVRRAEPRRALQRNVRDRV